MDYDLNYAKQFLGLLAKQAREEKEWDQEYLADELDIDIRTVRKIESGQGNIAYDLLTEIIHTLEICPQVLFYVDEADKGMKLHAGTPHHEHVQMPKHEGFVHPFRLPSRGEEMAYFLFCYAFA